MNPFLMGSLAFRMAESRTGNMSVDWIFNFMSASVILVSRILANISFTLQAFDVAAVFFQLTNCIWN